MRINFRYSPKILKVTTWLGKPNFSLRPHFFAGRNATFSVDGGSRGAFFPKKGKMKERPFFRPSLCGKPNVYAEIRLAFYAEKHATKKSWLTSFLPKKRYFCAVWQYHSPKGYPLKTPLRADWKGTGGNWILETKLAWMVFIGGEHPLVYDALVYKGGVKKLRG